MSKIKDFIANNNGVMVDTPEAAKEHLGDVDVVAYEGLAKDSFRNVVEAYKAPPSNRSRRYQEYDFGSDIVVFSSLRNIVDLVVAPPAVDTPVGTTIDPEEVVERVYTGEGEEIVEDDNDESEGTSGTTWF
jgi:hypothetical protein